MAEREPRRLQHRDERDRLTCKLMTVINDIQDKTAPLALAYGRHAVQGYRTKHVTSATEVLFQRALGVGPWDACEHLYAKGNEILPANFSFHTGLYNDAPDTYFPADQAHPGASYVGGKLVGALADEALLDEVEGIFRCLRTANYDGNGVQIDSNGNAIGGGNPDDYLFYDPGPARALADLYIRQAKRLPITMHWPAWVDWRDWSRTTIAWDDGSSAPKSFTGTPTTGGSLSNGTYYLKIISLKAGEVTSPAKEISVILTGSNTAISSAWAAVAGVDGYRVYIGTAAGAENVYFNVTPGTATSLLITSLGGTSGVPPAIATGTFLRYVRRFECHLFFQPPISLAVATQRVLQVACADQQWRNGKLAIMSPATRTPLMTVDASKIGKGSFKMWPIDRRMRPNQIKIAYRDLDTQLLDQADPFIVPPLDAPSTHPWKQLQARDGQIKTFELNIGCATKSQAERTAYFYGRSLIDMDQGVELDAAPSLYKALPGDVISITHTLPNWTDKQFKIRKKEETESKKGLHNLITAQLYDPNLYSDTDHSPILRPASSTQADPFAAPPQISSLALVERNVLQPDNTVVSIVGVTAHFASYINEQKGRVYYKKSKIIVADPATDTFTLANHGLANNTPVTLRNAGGGLPAPLQPNTTYFVVLATANTFKLAPSGQPAIDITTTGTGTHYADNSNEWIDTGTISPEPTTLVGGMEIAGVEKVSYDVMVVPESSFASAGLPGATPSSIVITGKLIAPAAPTSLTLTYEPIAGKIRGTFPASADGDIQYYEVYTVAGAVETLFTKVGNSLEFLYTPPSNWSGALYFKVYARNWSGVPSSTGATNNISPPSLPAGPTISFTQVGARRYYGLGFVAAVFEPYVAGFSVKCGSTEIYHGPDYSFVRDISSLSGKVSHSVACYDRFGNTGVYASYSYFSIGTEPPAATATTLLADITLSTPYLLALHVLDSTDNAEDVAFTRVQMRAIGGSWPASDTTHNLNGQIVRRGLHREILCPKLLNQQVVEVRVGIETFKGDIFYTDPLVHFFPETDETRHLQANASALNFGTITGGQAIEVTVNVPGAKLKDTVVVSPQALPGAIYMWSGRPLNDSGDVAVRLANIGATSAPALIDWNIDVFRHRSTLDNSLISHWKLDELSGTRNDSKGTNHLTSNNNVGVVGGKVDNAAVFTAASSTSLSVSSNATLQTGNIDFTLSGWIYLTSKTAIMDIVSKWGASGNFEYILIYNSTSDRLEFYVSSTGSNIVGAVANNYGSPATGAWIFFEVYHDSVNDVIGIRINNGTANTAAHSAGVFASTAAFMLGDRAVTAATYFNGRMDSISLWKRILTTSERSSLYNSGVGLDYPY